MFFTPTQAKKKNTSDWNTNIPNANQKLEQMALKLYIRQTRTWNFNKHKYCKEVKKTTTHKKTIWKGLT